MHFIGQGHQVTQAEDIGRRTRANRGVVQVLEPSVENGTGVRTRQTPMESVEPLRALRNGLPTILDLPGLARLPVSPSEDKGLGNGFEDGLDQPLVVHRSTMDKALSRSDFEIAARLGSGGMGDVQMATVHPDLVGEPRFKGFVQLALKTAKSGKEDSLREEAEIMSIILHPNIVRYIGFIKEPSKQTLVMEKCGGPTLWKYLRRYGPLTERAALDAFQQLLSAICHLHEQGLAHMDIKSDNVMIAESNFCGNADKTWKLIDFGLAVQCGCRERLYSSSFPIFRGTHGYIPPEMYCGQPIAPGKVDVWSLGVLLAEMVTGRMVFSPAAGSGIDSILNTRPSDIVSKLQQRSVSQRTINLVMGCFDVETTRPTASALLERVHDAISAI